MNPYLYIPIALAGVLVIIVAVMIIRAIAAGKPDTQSPSSADYGLGCKNTHRVHGRQL